MNMQNSHHTQITQGTGMEQKNSPRSLAMLIIAMTIFGTIGIFRKMIPLPSALIAFFRGIIGTVFLIFLVKISGKKLNHHLSTKVRLLLVLTGALIGINWMMLFEAYNYTSVSVATLCYYMEPTFVVILSLFVLKERLTLKKGVCSLLALVGMVLVSGILETGGLQKEDLTGVLLGIGAAVIYAVVILLNKSLPGLDSYEKTVIQLGSAALILLPYLLVSGSFVGNTWSFRTIALLLFVGIVHTGISYSLYFGSMDGLRTQTVALFSYIDPIVALFLSAWILHERMTLSGIIGAVLILGSAIVCELDK